MMTRSTQAPPTAFMDRLMLRIDPHQPPADDMVLNAQRACGRWLALRRLRMGLTSQQIAGIALVPVENILLLESGLGDPSSLTDSARRNLSRNLGKGKGEFDWVERVIAVAQGHGELLDDSVMAPIVAYLEAVDAGEIDRASPDAEEPAPAQAGAAVPIKAVSLKDEPDMFEIVRTLAGADTYIFAIWEQIHNHSQLGLGEIGSLIDRMLTLGLIEETEKPLLDPKLDSEPLQLYRMTPAGRQAYNAERMRRLAAEPASIPDKSREPGIDPATSFTSS